MVSVIGWRQNKNGQQHELFGQTCQNKKRITHLMLDAIEGRKGLISSDPSSRRTRTKGDNAPSKTRYALAKGSSMAVNVANAVSKSCIAVAKRIQEQVVTTNRTLSRYLKLKLIHFSFIFFIVRIHFSFIEKVFFFLIVGVRCIKGQRRMALQTQPI